MATKHKRNNDHYLSAPLRDQLRRQMRREKISMNQMAFELRMSRPHLSNMMNGHVPMAHMYLLAMRYVLLVAHAQAVRAERAAITGVDDE